VPVNTALASLIGMGVGRTPLNRKNMPTKTVEGYIGGIILTGIWAFYAAGYLAKYQYLICPQTTLQWALFDGLTCKSSNIFISKTFTIERIPLIGV